MAEAAAAAASAARRPAFFGFPTPEALTKGRACLPSTTDTAAEREKGVEQRRTAFLKDGGRDVFGSDLRFGQLEGFEYDPAQSVVVKCNAAELGAWFGLAVDSGARASGNATSRPRAAHVRPAHPPPPPLP